jgi:ethanolamine utilization protein EutA
MGVPIWEPAAGIRATVIGASQYTIQVSGNTIFLSSLDAVPVRNIPVVTPAFPLAEDEIEPAKIAAAIREALLRSDQHMAERPVALAMKWEGSATYQRIHAICQGMLEGMADHLAKDHPFILVCDRDIGGLLGLHIDEEMPISSPIISIDGIELKEFDFIDIGALIPSSGAVPVVIKSLIFPSEARRS